MSAIVGVAVSVGALSSPSLPRARATCNPGIPPQCCSPQDCTGGGGTDSATACLTQTSKALEPRRLWQRRYAQLQIPGLPPSGGPLPPGSPVSPVILQGPFGWVAQPNQRFAVNTLDGMITFVPSVPAGGGVATTVTKTGVSIALVPGLSTAGRYRWRAEALERGQRFVRRPDGLILTNAEGRRIARITLTRTPATALRHGVHAAQAGDEPPSAGQESDGFYVDYPGATDIDALSVVPLGDPDPLDCSATNTPGGVSEPDIGSGGTAHLSFYTAPTTSPKRSADAHAAYKAGECKAPVALPFTAGQAPGFFGYEYGRTTPFCDASVGAIVQHVRIKIEKAIGGHWHVRRSKNKAHLGGSVYLAETRTVCRNNNTHYWRAAIRYSAATTTYPYVESATAASRAYSDCG